MHFCTLQPDRSADATSAALSRAGSLCCSIWISICHHQTDQTSPDLVQAAYIVHRYADLIKVWPMDPASYPCCNSHLAPRHNALWLLVPGGRAGLTVVSKDQGASHVLQDAVASIRNVSTSCRLCLPKFLMDTTQASAACSSAQRRANYHPPHLTPLLRQRRQSLVHADDYFICRRCVRADLINPCRFAARSQANV